MNTRCAKPASVSVTQSFDAYPPFGRYGAVGLALVGAALSIGCGATIRQTEDGTYLATVKEHSALSFRKGAVDEAREAAREYCAERGSRAVVLNTHSEPVEGNGVLPSWNAEVEFSCVPRE